LSVPHARASVAPVVNEVVVTEILTALKGTPIPTLLIIAGIVFLLLGLTGGFAGKVRVPEHRQRGTTLIGGALVAVGLIVNFLVVPPSTGTSGDSKRQGEAAPPGPAPSSAVAAGEAPSRPVEPKVVGLLAEARKWTPVLLDAFESDQSGIWFLGEDKFKTSGGSGRSYYRIAEGRYRWQAQYDKSSRWTRPNQDPTTDFFATIDLRIAAIPDQSAAAGLTFRHRSDKFYYCLVTNSSQFTCVVDSDGQTRIEIPWTQTQTLARGAFNRLSIVGIGSVLRIYLNDIEVGVFSNDASLSGEVGLILETYASGVQATAEFDNFEIRRRP
jgi:hypothetical protein